MRNNTFKSANDGRREKRIADVIQRETPLLRAWLRKHAPSNADVEELLQETFCELVVAYRLTTPLREVSAWLYRVAKNRLTDLFRERGTAANALGTTSTKVSDKELEDAVAQVSDNAPGPEDAHFWQQFIVEVNGALSELPAAQREVFIAHEIEGLSFNEIAALTNENMKTLLWRKHAAVTVIRHRLRESFYSD